MEKINHYEELKKNKKSSQYIFNCEECNAQINAKHHEIYNGLCKKCYSAKKSEFHNTYDCACKCWYTAPDTCYSSKLTISQFGYSFKRRHIEY